jgi:signal peptidase I
MGQFYNRQFGKGVLFLLCWWVAAALCIGCIRNPFSNWMLLGLLFCYLFIWNDAIVTAVRTNGQEWSVRQSVALWFALMFYAGIVTTAAQFLLPTLVLVALVLWMNIVFALTHGDPHAMSRRHRIILLVGAIAVTSVFVLARQTNSARIFTFVRVNKDVSGDLIRKGDVVFVNNIAYWFSPPRVGDVIHFDPPRFSAEAGANVLGINIMDYFQRVCGVPGDRIEKRAGVFYRNGSPVPPGLEPVHGEVIPEWTFEVPRGHYFAPVTVIPPDLVTSAIGGALGAPRPPVMFTPGWNFPKWKESTMVPEKQVFGRAVAILNPPNHRAHLPRIGN